MFVDDVTLAGATAAGVSVSGRVLTSDGRGPTETQPSSLPIQGEPSGNAITSSFGYYRFDNVNSDETYVIGVRSKLYTFSSQIVSVSEDLADMNFIAEP